MSRASQKQLRPVIDRFKEAVAAGADILEATSCRLAVSPPWAHWGKVVQPVLNMVGTDDSQFLAGVEHLAAVVANAEVVYFQGCCHCPTLECPQDVRNTIMKFLGKHLTLPQGYPGAYSE